MRLNFHRAALSYLTDYFNVDLPARRALADRSLNPEVVSQRLQSWTGTYNIARNLARIEEDYRLAKVIEALRNSAMPETASEAISLVETVVHQFHGFYGKELKSAVSKLLWLRHQSPIVIYDSLVWGWLHDNAGLKYEEYAPFYSAWQTAFAEQSSHISNVCFELKRKGLLRFVAPDDWMEQEFSVLLDCASFRERVFDYAMLMDRDQQ